MKNILITIAFTVLPIIAGYFAYRWYQAEKIAKTIEPVKAAATQSIAVEAKNIARDVDKNGVEHAIIAGAQNAMQTVALLDTTSKKKLDSVLLILGIKEKQLQEYVSVNTTLRAENLALQENDTSYTYRDPYLAIDLHKPTALVPGLTARVQYNADLQHAAYWKRSWILAPKRNYIDFWMSDKRATINGVERLKIVTDPPAFAIGLDVIGDYSFKYKEFMPGAAVRLRMGRFGVSGGYMYDIDGQRWWPAVRGSYNLVEF